MLLNWMTELEITEDRWLGERLFLRQPARSYRVGVDAALLAAAIPKKKGISALELGTGVGAVALAVSAGVENSKVTAVEIQPELAELARTNVTINEMADRVIIIEADILKIQPQLRAYEEVFFNPPYLKPETNDASPDKVRRIATVEGEARLDDWFRVASQQVVVGGGVTVIHRADRLPDLLAAAKRAGIGSMVILPIWPRIGSPARRIIVRGIKGGGGPLRILAGLTLHSEGQSYTDIGAAVLRGDAPIDLN
jgi:tRNA1(Val) A37 N6-methylase TrmN6